LKDERNIQEENEIQEKERKILEKMKMLIEKEMKENRNKI
jgi:hypothetical protein